MRQRPGKRTGDAPPMRPAYDKALDLLARREHSRHELRTRLLREGYASDDIDTALTRLAAAHYQDDTRFATMLVGSRIRQGYGPQRLRVELQSHGLPPDLVAGVLEEADADWLTQARDQLQRHYGTTPPADYRERARRMQFLIRRGFDLTIARAATQVDVER